MITESNLKVCQFNCFALNPRTEQVRDFMLSNDIDFLAMNELKVSEEKSNELLNSVLANFNVVIKTRQKNNDCGGGVAIIFKKSIVCTELDCFDYLVLELVAVEAETSIGTVAIIAYYNPPPRKLNKKLFHEVEKRFRNFIICGDLNAHSECLGIKKNKQFWANSRKSVSVN